MILLAAACAPPGWAEPVKYIKPEQYDARIVAPKKGRVLLVNFWKTDCGPCKDEMPALLGASKKFTSRELAVILVSLDTSKTAFRDVPVVLGQLKVPFVAYLAKTHDPRLFVDAVDAAWDGKVPFAIVYSREGIPLFKFAGGKPEAKLVEGIRKALAASSRR